MLKLIKQNNWNSDRNNGVNRLSIWQNEDVVLKIEIHIDRSYDFQSRAYSEMFTPDGWKLVYFMPYPSITMSLDKDELDILTITKQILRIK